MALSVSSFGTRVKNGYRYYSHYIYHFHMSVDVIFFQETPYFSSPTEPNIVSQVLPIPHFLFSSLRPHTVSWVPESEHASQFIPSSPCLLITY